MIKGRDVILVTGATGNQGNAVARHLLFQGHRVRAMTRKPDGAAAQALAALGAEVVQGDLDVPSSVDKALAGAVGAFAVQNTWEAGVEREEVQGKAFAEQARAAGVQHFVYTSVGSAGRATGIPHFDNKYRVEQTVRRLGFPTATVLRPVFFMDNLGGPWMKGALLEGQVKMAIQPTTKLQMVACNDIGRIGALAFEQPELMNGRAIEIAGAELTWPEACAILSRLSGRKIEFVQLPIEAVRAQMADYAAMCEWFDAVGYDAAIGALATDYRVRLTSFEEWALAAKPWA